VPATSVGTTASTAELLDRHLRARLRAQGEVCQVGPFLAGFDADSVNPFRNYALPDPWSTPSLEDVARLVEEFRRRDRLPRLEYFPSCAPAVEETLQRAGFTVDLRPTVMTCRPGDGSGVSMSPLAGVRLIAVDEGSWPDVAGACVVAHLAFGEEGMPEEADLQRLARSLAGGGGAVLARVEADDEPVGTAQFMAPVADAGELSMASVASVVEVVGVAVLEGYRGRGIALSMLAMLLDLASQRGVEVAWLTPAGDGAQRVYQRAGFRPATEALHLSLAS
jgi:GNAT superfamily N-acetyltransferase